MSASNFIAKSNGCLQLLRKWGHIPFCFVSLYFEMCTFPMYILFMTKNGINFKYAIVLVYYVLLQIACNVKLNKQLTNYKHLYDRIT